MKEAESSCKEKRRKFLEDRGIENKEIEEGRSGEGDRFERAIKMKKEKQREEIWEKIIYLEYNIWYK